MEILTKILQLILSLSLLVLIHEFGHYIFARIFKCRVDKFYLFFNPWFSIFKKKIGDTEYGIGWLPLGGYCKIAGMVDESMDKEQMAEPAKPWEYRSKPAWQRLLIIVGGVLMNFLLAIIIYIGMTFAWGDSYVKTADVNTGFSFSTEAHKLGFRNGDRIISIDGESVAQDNYRKIHQTIILSSNRQVEIERNGERQIIKISDDQVKNILNAANLIELRMPFVLSMVEDGSAAQRAGLMVGDSIVAVDSVNIAYFDESVKIFADNASKTVNLTLVRNGEMMTLPVEVNDKGKIGVGLNNNIANQYKISSTDYTLLQSIPKGVERGVDQVDNYLKQLKLIASPETEAYKSVGGFITMGKIFPSEWDWYSFWSITALLSIMLAVINILPIPALDGGHMVFLIYEIVTRRAPSERFMEIAQYVGFFLLLALLIYANGSDVLRLFS